jgi:S-adenosylmethionine synthetase
MSWRANSGYSAGIRESLFRFQVQDGIAFLAPEIQLLYKARATRAKDQADFDQVVPHLDREARTWLRQSLARLDPEHVWNSMLKETYGANHVQVNQ